ESGLQDDVGQRRHHVVPPPEKRKEDSPHEGSERANGCCPLPSIGSARKGGQEWQDEKTNIRRGEQAVAGHSLSKKRQRLRYDAGKSRPGYVRNPTGYDQPTLATQIQNDADGQGQERLDDRRRFDPLSC